MNYWIVQHHSGYGVDIYAFFQAREPTNQQIIKKIEVATTYEPDKGEWLEINGPLEVPTASRQELEAAYSKGWDSHEGSLLKILGIRDLECQGIDQIVADLVKRCSGFKEWRRRYKDGSMEQRQTRAAGWKRRKK